MYFNVICHYRFFFVVSPNQLARVGGTRIGKQPINGQPVIPISRALVFNVSSICCLFSNAINFRSFLFS
jgi:hypothetical protein